MDNKKLILILARDWETADRSVKSDWKNEYKTWKGFADLYDTEEAFLNDCRLEYLKFSGREGDIVVVGENNFARCVGARNFSEALTENYIAKAKQKFANLINSFSSYAEIKVVIHLNNSDFANFVSNLGTQGNVKNFARYSSVEDNDVKKDIEDFWQQLKRCKDIADKKECVKKAVDKQCEGSLWTSITKQFLLEYLTLLLHRIAHLFLPLDIDLMGICEVLKDDFKPPQDKTKEKWAEEYYNEAFKNTSPKDRFKNLCDQARKEIERAKLEDDKKEAILQMFNCDNINLGLPNEFDIDKFKKWAENPEQNPFHQWFCNVMQKLEEIKKQYSGKSDVKGNEDEKEQ